MVQSLKDIVNAPPDGKVFLASVDPDERLELNLMAVQHTVNAGKSLIFVTVKYPITRLEEALTEMGAYNEENVFIDAITKTVSEETDIEQRNVMYMESPHNLSNIGTSVSVAAQRVGHQSSMLFVDSLETLLTYNSERQVARFLQDLKDRIQTLDMNAVLFHEGATAEEALDSALLQYIDDVVFLQSQVSADGTVRVVDDSTASVEFPRYYLTALDWREDDAIKVSVEDDNTIHLRKD